MLFAAKEPKNLSNYLLRMIFRVAPMFWPACEAPLLVPACRPITALPAWSTSSENSRLFSSAGFGPSQGPGHSGCLYDCIQNSYELTRKTK